MPSIDIFISNTFADVTSCFINCDPNDRGYIVTLYCKQSFVLHLCGHKTWIAFFLHLPEKWGKEDIMATMDDLLEWHSHQVRFFRFTIPTFIVLREYLHSCMLFNLNVGTVGLERIPWKLLRSYPVYYWTRKCSFYSKLNEPWTNSCLLMWSKQ